ncbi:MAG: helix-turn-helix domain-containing protein [Candidatus Methanoperedens sp.]|nr:helix-turn-helix domain-containing protein [Candidatus Methanoperedens sp.]
MSNEELLFELFANKYSRAILSHTAVNDCSASQLSQELDIPLATVYRKLKLLEDAGLIQHVKTIINTWGNEEKYYRCAAHEAVVHINGSGVSIDLKKEDRSDKIIRLWRRIAHPDIKGDH